MICKLCLYPSASRVVEDEAFAFGEDVKQHYAFRIRQDDGGGEFRLGNPAPTARRMGGAVALTLHTLAYLLVLAFAALIVCWRLGLALLRTAWLNLDLIWAAALVLTGVLIFFI